MNEKIKILLKEKTASQLVKERIKNSKDKIVKK